HLGLPPYMPPWYPLLRIPVNLTRSGAALLLPGGTDRAAARGRRNQEEFLRTLIGEQEAVIGASVRHVGHAA
ncbi:oxygenase MpaB family protein, partial [Nocardia gipuzkoensis]